MKYFLIYLLSFSFILTQAQSRCVSQYLHQQKVSTNPLYRDIDRITENKLNDLLQNQSNENPKTNTTTSNKTTTVVTIPVVVHVVYNTPSQNISEAQIRAQISVLNEDYRLKNPDSLPVTHPFWPLSADAEYEFCLATKDPSGNPTNGITRTFTSTTDFDADINGDDVKLNVTGGHDNWNPNLYLNIWVCNLVNGVLGYATFPNELAINPELDGLVIGYKYFGVGGTTIAPLNKGRTVTHETGHWLGLYHPCETNCDNDFVADTPPCEELNYGCPSFPHRPNNLCGGNANGEMYMNFMDYVDDACMNTFTYGQAVRMRNQLNTYRNSVATANKCVSTASINDNEMIKFSLYPNPTADFVEIYFGNEQNFVHPIITISDALGREMIQKDIANISSIQIDISSLSNGIYYIIVADQTHKTTKQLTIVH